MQYSFSKSLEPAEIYQWQWLKSSFVAVPLPNSLEKIFVIIIFFN